MAKRARRALIAIAAIGAAVGFFALQRARIIAADTFTGQPDIHGYETVGIALWVIAALAAVGAWVLSGD